MGFRFSVVMAAYNSGAYIAQALDSLVNQSLDFKENIQVIIVNDASSDNTESVCMEYVKKYPDNIVLISNRVNCGPAHTRNIGLAYAEGEIINFLDSDDYMSKKTFEKVDIFFDDFIHVDIASIPIKFFGSKRGDHPLNYKYKGTGVINLLEDPEAIQLSSASAFFRRDAIEESVFNSFPSRFDGSEYSVYNGDGSFASGPVPMVFNERLSVSEDALLINQMLLRNPLLGILSDCTYFYRKKATDSTSLISDSANHRSYFTTRVDNYIIGLINDSLGLYSKVPEFIQYAIMYDLQWIMEIRQVDHLLDLDDLTRLYDRLISILFYIGDKVIFKQRSIPSILKGHIVLIKYFGWGYLDSKSFNFNQIEEKYYGQIGNLVPFAGKDELAFIIQNLELNKVYLDIVEVRNIKSGIDLNDSGNGSRKFMSSVDFGDDEDSRSGTGSDDDGKSKSSIDQCDGKGKELYISGMITSFFNRDFDIYAVVSDSDRDSSHIHEREIKVTRLSYPQRDNLSLNFNYGYNHCFEVCVPITGGSSRISFRTDFANLNGICRGLGIDAPSGDSIEDINHNDILFSGDLLIDYNHMSRLSRISNYKISKDYLIVDDGKQIVVTDRTAYKMLKFEIVTLMSIALDRGEGWRTGIVLRLLYFALYPFFRNRRIWIFMDLPYTADDNGLQLFKSVRKMDSLGLDEFNRLLELDEEDWSLERHPYKYELFEGKDVRLIGIVKDIFSSIGNVFRRDKAEENGKVKFMRNGSLDLDESVNFNDESELSFEDYLNEHLELNSGDESGFDQSEGALGSKDDSSPSNDSSLIRSSFEEDLEYASDFRKNSYARFGFVRSFDESIDRRYHNAINSLDSRLDRKYNDIRTDVKDYSIRDKVPFAKDSDEDFKRGFNFYDAIYYFSLSDHLRGNKLIYLINYILYRISRLFLRRRRIKRIDNRKVKKYFALEQSTSHFNNVRHMENQYIASSTKDKLRKLLGREKQSREYKALKKIGPVLAYKSLKHRIYALYAEVIVSSHPDNNLIYPFYGNFPHLAGLVKAKTVFLQHGVTKDDVSYWLNRFDKNLDMIVTVSDLERDSFLPKYDGGELISHYGYEDDTVKVLGFPRFDYLEGLEDRKEIVIMPTWRRQLHNLKDEEFVQTNFFRTFNALINDKVLLDYLGSRGYRLVFKPHPNLNKYIRLFDKDSRVEFDLNDLNFSDSGDKSNYVSRRYADIFNHSSLLVTDFSSVSFDFAYLRKPLIYYHYDNDYHFDSENGYFDYGSMGFGPVLRSHKELVMEIIDSIESGCDMDGLYRSRVDGFFKYNDRDNSRRVYKAILEMDKYY